MTSDENKPSPAKSLKSNAKPIRMLVTSFGLGRGKTLSGRSLVTPKFKVTPADAGVKAASPEKMVSSSKRAPVFAAFDGLYKDVAYHVDPTKREISFSWDFSNHKGYYNLPPAAMAKLNTIDYGEQIVTKQDAIRHAKTSIDIIHRGVENIFYAPKRNEMVTYHGGALTEGDVEKQYGKPPSPVKMVSPKKLSPSMISPNLRKLEALRTPVRGVQGEGRTPVLTKRGVNTVAKQNPHKTAVEKYNVIDIQAAIAPLKKLSPQQLAQQPTPQAAPKAPSPIKRVSPVRAPRMPTRVSPSKASPSKFGGLTATSKRATVLPNTKIPMSHYDPETASSKVEWENKIIGALNSDGDDDYAYELYYDEYVKMNDSVNNAHHVQFMERAVNTLRKKLAVDNMRIAKEAFDKYDLDKSLEYFTRSWFNNKGNDNETDIHRAFQKKFRVNNNTIQSPANKVNPISPGYANSRMKSADKAKLSVRRDEVINVLNDLVRNMTIVRTGPASVKILSGNVEITKKACSAAIIEGFDLVTGSEKRRLRTRLGDELVFDDISIKFALDRSNKVKVKGTYRGYKYFVDQVAGEYSYGVPGRYAETDEFEPMTYTNDELVERIQHNIDLAIGKKPSPKGVQKMPSPEKKVQKTPSPVKKVPSPEKKIPIPENKAVKVTKKQIQDATLTDKQKREVRLEVVNEEIKELSEEINAKAKKGMKATEMITQMNALIMKRDILMRDAKHTGVMTAKKPGRR